MNKRQIKKYLKKQIENLRRDNNLMKDIIYNSPSMSELYDKFNKPVGVITSGVDVKQYKAKRHVEECFNNQECIEMIKVELADSLFDEIKNNISYEIDTNAYGKTITASIIIGKKG